MATGSTMFVDINLLQQCAPNVATITMAAIINTESRGKPWGIGLNRGKRLKYQPNSYEQAVAWVNYLEANRYDFDIGLAQVNIRNAHKYGYKAYQLLDQCTNVKVASDILQKNYSQALNRSINQQDALMKAISAYNTGNYQSGFRNGYVNRVVSNVQGHKAAAYVSRGSSYFATKSVKKPSRYASLNSKNGKIKLTNIQINSGVVNVASNQD